MPYPPDRPVDPPPPPAPAPADAPLPADAEGMLDLDDHDQINNQHLEVR